MPMNRRRHNRIKLEADITAQIIDQKGSPVGSALYGCLQDISVGGACFTIQCSKKDVGLTLLARMTTLTILFEKGLHIKVNGLILGAVFDLLGSCTIHLHFSQQFSKESFKKFIDICQKLKSPGGSEALQKDLESLMAKKKQSPKVLGEVKEQRKSVEIIALTRAIKENPRDVKLMQKLANLYISYELYEEAVKPLKFAIKLNPRVADFQYLLGYTYYKAQYFQKSLAPLSLAVRLNPKFSKTHYYLWMVNELVGIEEAAQKHYQIAIELDPDIENKV